MATFAKGQRVYVSTPISRTRALRTEATVLRLFPGSTDTYMIRDARGSMTAASGSLMELIPDACTLCGGVGSVSRQVGTEVAPGVREYHQADIRCIRCAGK